MASVWPYTSNGSRRKISTSSTTTCLQKCRWSTAHYSPPFILVNPEVGARLSQEKRGQSFTASGLPSLLASISSICQIEEDFYNDAHNCVATVAPGHQLNIVDVARGIDQRKCLSQRVLGSISSMGLAKLGQTPAQDPTRIVAEDLW